MTAMLDRQFLESVEQAAFEVLSGLEDHLVRAMLDSDGLAYGDLELERRDRIEKFMYDEVRGVNSALQMSDPEEYERRLTQFRQDVSESGFGGDV